MRNKAFLIGTPSWLGLRYSTTASTRVEMDLPYEARLARLSGKYDRLLALDSGGDLHVYELRDPHPEADGRALFGRVWYEGGQAPTFTWQSTGATDDFEPKLSMMPLIFGTLKGTFYAMIFAVPLALLAAMYTSQFLHPDLRTVVKPTMEIMASLPSVILGFLAALWLAPILETRVLSFVLVVMLMPTVAVVMGYVWSSIPSNVTSRYVKQGYEFVAVFPLLALAAYGAWLSGPLVERLLFVVTDASTGERVADFRLWWVQTTGLSFEQRNSLVVGLIMGFAVIPIIFTIAEDALSNVPPELKAGSLALGASRWQTAIRIVLPTASAGIFFGHDDRTWARRRRDDDRADGDRKHPDRRLEHFFGHAHAVGKYCSGAARSPAVRHPVSHSLPGRDAAFPDDVSDQYPCGAVAAAPAGEIQNGVNGRDATCSLVNPRDAGPGRPASRWCGPRLWG